MPKLFVALAIALAALPVAAADSSWTLVKDEQGIQVFRRPVEGSSLYAVRGQVRIGAGMDRLVSLLKDHGARPQWDRHCGETYVVQKLGENEELVYLRAELPWPVKDRDMLMHARWTEDPASGAVHMHATAVAGAMPARKDRIRVAMAEASWALTPLADGRVEVVTETHVEPGGPLPAWIINPLTIDGPYDALLRIRQIVADADADTDARAE